MRKKGFKVTVIDAIGMGINRFWKWEEREGFCCQGASFQEILEAIPKDADVLAFSTMFSGEWPLNRALIKTVHGAFPSLPTLAGGEHATALPEYSLRDCPELNFMATGEGEQILFEFCETLRKKEDAHTVFGVKYLDKNGTYVNTGVFPRIKEVDEIPWPDWGLAPLQPYWKAQKSFGVSSARDMPIMASRGCPYRCTFCSNPQMWTTRYILRDVNDVLDEIEFYIDKYQITSLQFYDLTAITKKSWTIEFCTKMIERGIRLKWSLPSGTRSEVLDEEVLPLLAKTNCIYLVYAPESGSPDTLKKIKKQIKLERFNESIKTALKNGLTLRVNIIIGFPHETRRHVYESILYGWKLMVMGVEEAMINLYSPYPGSELFDELTQEKKLQLSDDYFYSLTSLNSDYTHFNPLTFCRYVGALELSFYRIFSIFTNYFIAYILYPKRILRTLKGLFKPGEAATLLEHRLQDLFKRKWVGISRGA